MHTVKEILKTAASMAHLKTRKELSEFIEIPYDSVNNWTKGKFPKISSDGILAITKKINISRKYLETGKGNPELNDSGVSDYGHSARASEVAKAYESMSNDDQKLLYSLAMRLKNDTKKYSYLDDIDILGED